MKTPTWARVAAILFALAFLVSVTMALVTIRERTKAGALKGVKLEWPHS